MQSGQTISSKSPLVVNELRGIPQSDASESSRMRCRYVPPLGPA